MGHKGRKLKSREGNANHKEGVARKGLSENGVQSSYLIYNTKRLNAVDNLPKISRTRTICYNTYAKWRQRQTSSWFSICANSLLSKLPQLRDCNEADRESLFIQKLRRCCVVFDFVSDPPSYEKLKDAKRITLNELVEYVLMHRNVFTQAIYAEAFNMFAVNIFRSLPPPKRKECGWLELEDEDIQYEQAWPHLELVYELFKEFLDSPDMAPHVAQKYLSRKYILKLFSLFESEDPRERKFLSIILQKMYIVFVVLRPTIRKEISDILYTFIYETETHNGIADILDVVKCLIRGYTVPLKKENRLFLLKVVLPLHKTASMPTYFEELLQCVILFLKKDPSLIVDTVEYLLRYWPKTNTLKEIRFLDEITTLLSSTTSPHLKKFINPLVKQMNRCCLSYNQTIAEKAIVIKQCIPMNLVSASTIF